MVIRSDSTRTTWGLASDLSSSTSRSARLRVVGAEDLSATTFSTRSSPPRTTCLTTFWPPGAPISLTSLTPRSVQASEISAGSTVVISGLYYMPKICRESVLLCAFWWISAQRTADATIASVVRAAPTADGRRMDQSMTIMADPTFMMTRRGQEWLRRAAVNARPYVVRCSRAYVAATSSQPSPGGHDPYWLRSALATRTPDRRLYGDMPNMLNLVSWQPDTVASLRLDRFQIAGCRSDRRYLVWSSGWRLARCA